MRRLALCVALAAVMFPVSVRSSAGVTEAQWTWKQSGATGGGFQNVIVADPSSRGAYLLGGELSGFHRTTNSGAKWLTSNKRIKDFPASHVAAIAFSKKNPRRVFAATGPPRGGGRFLMSRNRGVSWKIRSGGGRAPQMSSLAPLCGPDHPRAVGNLIALDERTSTRYIYVGSLNGGIKRSTNNGRTWKTIGLNGAYIRTLVTDPDRPTILYAGVCAANGFSGAYKIKMARSSAPVVKRLTAAPPTVEEFAVVGKALYAAANSSGIYRVTNRGATWKKRGANFFPTSSRWSAIDGVRTRRGNRVLYVGGAAPVNHGNGKYRSIARSANGGRTWKWRTVSPSGIHKEMVGTNTPWWLAISNPRGSLGGPNFVASQIAVSPTDAKTVLVAGRGGVWQTRDGGNNWRPAARGLGTLLTNAVEAKGSKMYAGVGDWTAVASPNYGRTVRRLAPGGGTFGYSVMVAPDGTTFLGPGNRDANTEGELFSSPNPFKTSLSDENIPAGGKRIAAVGTGYASDSSKIVLAAVQGGGIFRRVGSGSWLHVALPAAINIPGTRAEFAWPKPHGPYVYLAVPGAGLFRSNDRGVTWTKIWDSTIDVAGDPTARYGQRIYVYRDNGVYRIGDARTGTVMGDALKPVKLPIPQIGPVAVGGGGAVYVAGTGSPAGFYRSTNLGSSWKNRADRFYPRAAVFPIDVAASDNHYYVALKRNGVIVGKP